jgi:hypothetical protein
MLFLSSPSTFHLTIGIVFRTCFLRATDYRIAQLFGYTLCDDLRVLEIDIKAYKVVFLLLEYQLALVVHLSCELYIHIRTLLTSIVSLCENELMMTMTQLTYLLES